MVVALGVLSGLSGSWLDAFQQPRVAVPIAPSPRRQRGRPLPPSQEHLHVPHLGGAGASSGGRSACSTSLSATPADASSAAPPSRTVPTTQDPIDQLNQSRTDSGAKSGGGGLAGPAPHANLYQILGARGNESRAELKQKYIALAKQYHPDAASTSTSAVPAPATAATTTTDFAEIAAAWRILADPKQRQRYDRTLKAEAFSQEVVEWASAFTKQAGPVLEKFAIPLLRRTTATTLAGVQAVVDDLGLQSLASDGTAVKAAAGTTAARSKPDPSAGGSARRGASPATDLSRTFQAAMAAAKRAGEYVDSVELLEQASTLEERADEKEQALRAILGDLRQRTRERLHMALHTPKSGLTASEALLVLREEFNQTVANASVGSASSGGGLWQQLLHSKSIHEEIDALQQLERGHQECLAEDLAVQADYQYHLEQQAKEQATLRRAKQAERDAMRALELAREQVTNASQALDAATYTVQQAEQYVKKSSYELERTSQTVEAQSEKVRKALWQKEREILQKKGLKTTGTTIRDALNEEERIERLQKLQELRQQEEIMRESSRILQGNTERLRSRALKLQEKATQLDGSSSESAAVKA